MPEQKTTQTDSKHDPVHKPSHYCRFGVEAKDIVRFVLNHPNNAHLTPYQAFFLGNALKYRLRAGFKDGTDPMQDIDKSLECSDLAAGDEPGRFDAAPGEAVTDVPVPQAIWDEAEIRAHAKLRAAHSRGE